MDPRNPQQSTLPPTSTPPEVPVTPPSPSFTPQASPTPTPPMPNGQPPMPTPMGQPPAAGMPTPVPPQPQNLDASVELHEHKKTPLWILWVIIAVVIGVSVVIFMYISNKSTEESAAVWPALAAFLS